MSDSCNCAGLIDDALRLFGHRSYDIAEIAGENPDAVSAELMEVLGLNDTADDLS